MKKQFKKLMLIILANTTLWTGIFILAMIKTGIYVVG